MSLLLIVIALVALMTLAVEGRVRFPVLNRVVIAVISPVQQLYSDVYRRSFFFGKEAGSYYDNGSRKRAIKKRKR